MAKDEIKETINLLRLFLTGDILRTVGVYLIQGPEPRKSSMAPRLCQTELIMNDRKK
ncbi:MAG: hypothetical protein ACJ8FY_20570 [Gemmataceae bacterium]